VSGPRAIASLRAAFASAGRSWRWRRLLQGACALLAGSAAVWWLAILIMDTHRFQHSVVGASRVAVYLAMLALALAAVVARMPRSRDAAALARHLESRDPSLDALLITAAESATREVDDGLERRLYARAAAVCADPAGPTRADRIEARRAGAVLASLGVALIVALWAAPPGWRHGARVLAAPWVDPRAGMPYAIDAHPGSVQVLEHEDVTVNARPRGFVPDAVELVFRPAGGGPWQREHMPRGAANDFEGVLAAVRVPVEYYLEAQSVRSPRHRVSVQALPRVKRLDHRYRFPAYTARAPQLVEGATDVAAVAGTRVDLQVIPLGWPARGELVLDGERRVALVPREQGLHATFTVDEAVRYRVELALADGTLVPVTPDHQIAALDDGAPTVRLVRPGNDVRVTAVEEMEVEVHAEDDVGLRRVELVLSVNGDPEQVVPLETGASGTPSLAAVYALPLEERGLSPGDIVAFHARASDGVEARSAVTDIHFMEVRPFDRDYRRAASGRGRRGGGGAQQGDDRLAAQQRDLVVALFRLARDGARLAPEERDQRLTTLSDAQARIRQRVDAIVRRLQGRSMMDSRPGLRVMLDAMPRASAAMLRVESLLAVPDPEQALPPAREALAHLQRADAAFREVQVASRSGGGGGGSQSGDLSRLFELEMDRFRNRYSQVQRGEWQRQQRQVDETLEELRRLARRQRQEIERAARRAARPDLGGSGAPTQQALARELEELLRRLERLTRERHSGAMEESRRALEDAAKAMRESARGGGSAADRTRAARDALRKLEQARSALALDEPARIAKELEQAARRAEDLAARQDRMRRELQADGTPDRQQVDRAKAGMEEDAADLRRQLDRIAAGAAAREPEVAGRARGAAGVMREQDVEGRLRRSREQVARGTADPGLEAAIGRALNETREQVAQAARAAAERARNATGAQGGEDGRGAGAGSPERARRLLRELAGLREQLQRLDGAVGLGPGGRDVADLQARAGELDRLRDPVADNPGAAGDLQALIDGIRALADESAAAGTQSPPGELLDTLGALERALGPGSREQAVVAGRQADAPVEYRDLVEQFYRRLGGQLMPAR
jgi:hypothetical protein